MLSARTAWVGKAGRDHAGAAHLLQLWDFGRWIVVVAPSGAGLAHIGASTFAFRLGAAGLARCPDAVAHAGAGDAPRARDLRLRTLVIGVCCHAYHCHAHQRGIRSRLMEQVTVAACSLPPRHHDC